MQLRMVVLKFTNLNDELSGWIDLGIVLDMGTDGSAPKIDGAPPACQPLWENGLVFIVVSVGFGAEDDVCEGEVVLSTRASSNTFYTVHLSRAHSGRNHCRR